jgi:DNA-binding CsgD family transcriptional regulator
VYRRGVATATRAALLEREHELNTLRDGLDRARSGDGAVLLVEGPAGAGKTELVREARAAAAAGGMLTLEAKGSELEQPFAFGVVRQLLESEAGPGGAAGELFAGAAAPAARLFETDERGRATVDTDFEALHSLYWLAVNLADRAPVLLSVDDCHWSDGDSLRFLSYLGQRIDGLRVAILLAGRPPDASTTEAAALWGQLASRADAVVLYPRPLSEAAAVGLVRERLGSEAADEFCRACHAATGGNPLFLRELLGALDAAGVVPSAGAASDVQAVGPAAVARFVRHRLWALGPSATELARSVAVLGDGSEPQLAAHVAGLGEDEARAGADDLVRADIFARTARLAFVHPIVRAALYEELAPGERQARHAAAADALSRLGASSERVTAHLLLTRATGDARRVRTLRSAARAAATRGAPHAAAARLTRALDESPADQERAAVLAELGRYEIAAMQFEAAEEHLSAVVNSTAELATRVEAAAALARCVLVSGSRSADLAQAALVSLAKTLARVDVERSLEVECDLVMVTTVTPRLRPGLGGHLARFREKARGHPEFEAVAEIHTALEQLLRGGSADAAAAAVHAALTAGLPSSAAENAGFLAIHMLRLAEHYDVPLRLLDRTLEGARRDGHTARQGLIHGQRAWIALARGSLPDAQIEAETGLQLIGEPHFALPQLLAAAVIVHVEDGDLDRAETLARIGTRFASSEDQLYVDYFLTARSRLRIAQGRLREGVADLLWCGERLGAQGVQWPCDWRAYAAPAIAALGEHERALALVHEQLAVARTVGAPGALGLSLRAAARVVGDAEALPLLHEAMSVLEPSPAKLELAHTLTDLASVLNRAGQRREGRAAARRAVELAGQCGAAPLAAAAWAELQAGPGRPARTELTGPNALTAAEWRVCRQAAEGQTNREIAQALFVTEKTVERHLSSAYHKLAIRSRHQLAAAIGH